KTRTSSTPWIGRRRNGSNCPMRPSPTALPRRLPPTASISSSPAGPRRCIFTSTPLPSRTNSTRKNRRRIVKSLPEPVTLFCARCATELQSGSGNLYRITIETVADPLPPFIAADPPDGLRGRMQALLAELEDLSEREAMDQVYRRLILYLCGTCYRKWIE